MQTITITSSTTELISPGVRAGATYKVLERGADWFKIRLHNRSVYINSRITTLFDPPQRRHRDNDDE